MKFAIACIASILTSTVYGLVPSINAREIVDLEVCSQNYSSQCNLVVNSVFINDSRHVQLVVLLPFLSSEHSAQYKSTTSTRLTLWNF